MINCEELDTEGILATSKRLMKQNEVEKLMRTMTKEIEVKLGDLNLVILTIMSGGLVPTGIFMKYFKSVCELDYIHLTRYGNQTTGGEIKWHRRPQSIVKNRNVLLIDDILDRGITLETAMHECYNQGANSVHTAVMVKKNISCRSGVQNSDFFAVELPEGYLFGSGLDYKGYFRNLDGIYSLNENQQLPKQ